ncbi:OmpA family protein [Nitratireductor mangrovi]|uniref:OmpA family protein n=1 Tax=Nitratireductor mangrovi TaxID=2599600 RepID=A0A5B8KYE6_9HYPH|nr:OmpA family protein [Nitratireductor mangrovi]QDZ00581.1 OmpA family protein [Nitratireductor mangrovi]
MTLHARILAGSTALALLLGVAPAYPASATYDRIETARPTGQLLLAQNDNAAEEAVKEELPPKEDAPAAEEAAPAAEEAPAAQEPPPEAAQPADKPAAEAPTPEVAPEPAPKQQQPTPEAAPEPEPKPEAAEEPAATAEPAQAQEAEPADAPEQPVVEEITPEPEPKPAEEQPDAADDAPADAEQPAAEPAEQPEAEAEQPAATEEPAPADDPEEPAAEEPAAEEPAMEEPAAEEPAASTPAEEPPAEEPETEAAQPPAEQPDAAAGEPAEQAEGEPAQDGNAAPILDSAKEQPAEQAVGEPSATDPAAPADEQTAAPAGEENAPPPETDAAAQDEEARPEQLESAIAEEGERVERQEAGEDRERRRERPEGAEVVREFGDRFVIQFNNQTFVESSDRPRLRRDASEVYYERLPRGREREVIVRPNGSRIVTIRNRYGDVVRRSRITPDGREIVLVYVDERHYERVRDWRDPGADLPPLRLRIPARDYILDARRVERPETYYEFLDQPPVEKVRRLYSIDEVKRSARIRDTVRRVDLDTITFEFGSASIAESEVARLEGVATAIERLLEENPGETFLIEGHTDAVGSDLANLALSDQRAEAVAVALTNVFGIPPENLVTQGYGERYLKVRTEERERENRRVAIRRITPLVAPVAQAN